MIKVIIAAFSKDILLASLITIVNRLKDHACNDSNNIRIGIPLYTKASPKPNILSNIQIDEKNTKGNLEKVMPTNNFKWFPFDLIIVDIRELKPYMKNQLKINCKNPQNWVCFGS